MASATDVTPRRLFLVSVPRTASNLLVKILSMHRQPNVFTNEKAGYFFQDAFFTGISKGYFRKPVDQWTDDEKAEIRGEYQKCLNSLEAASEQARREGKIMFTKEHSFWFLSPAAMLDRDDNQAQQREDFCLTFPDVYGQKQSFSENNKTIFPDAYLRTWRFAFLIRHPALALPSMYRAGKKLAKIRVLDDDGVETTSVANVTWRWTRHLFDWCCEQQPGGLAAPLILDAHDVIHNPDAVLRFCEETGLDKNVVQFEWEHDKSGAEPPTPQSDVLDPDQVKESIKIMTSSLSASKGIIKDKAPAVVEIDAEVDKWKEEFGVEAAALLEEAARAAMPDYEYLRERRLKV